MKGCCQAWMAQISSQRTHLVVWILLGEQDCYMTSDEASTTREENVLRLVLIIVDELAAHQHPVEATTGRLHVVRCLDHNCYKKRQ